MGKPHSKSPRKISSAKKSLFLLIFSCCLFFFFCLFHLQTQDLVNVEFLTSDSVRKDWMSLLLNRLNMGHPPLYFFLTKFWVTIFGHNINSLYAFSAVIGAIGIPLFYLLALELNMGKWASLAPLIWCVHPSLLYYARYLRPQIGIIVLTTLFLLILLKNLDRPRTFNRFLLLALGLIGAVWSHLFLFFWLGVLFASLFLKTIRTQAPGEHWFFIISALIFQVVMALVVKYFSGAVEGNLGWIKPMTFQSAIEVLLQALSTTNGMTNSFPPSYLWAVPIATLLSFFVALIPRGEGASIINAQAKWNLLLTSALIILAILMGLSVTFRPLWVPRYLVIVLPVFMLTIVQAIALTRGAAIFGTLVLAGMVINSLAMIEQRNFGLRDMVAQLEEQYDEKRDALMILSFTTGEALQLYTQRDFHPFTMEKDSSSLLLEDSIRGRERLWVLEYPRKAPIMRSKFWKRRLKPRKFYEYRIDKTALLGFSANRMRG